MSRVKHEGSIKSYDGAFLDCRGSQHDWYLAGYFKAGKGLIGRYCWCERCDTIRIDTWVQSSGERLPSRYDYPDGYQIDHNGDSPASKADFRKEIMRRVAKEIYANKEGLLQQTGRLK